MSTVTLTFSLPEETGEAVAAMRAMELTSALQDIDNRARSSLKYDGDHQRALEEIRRIARDILGQVDGDGPVLAPDPKMLQPVAGLGLSHISVKYLMAGGISTVGDLVQRSETELLKTPNLGRRSLNEIKVVLAVHGLRLRGSPPKNDPDPHPTEAHQ